MNDQQVEKVFKMLMSAKFVYWYENEFLEFVEGQENAKTKEEILKDLKRMLGE